MLNIKKILFSLFILFNVLFLNLSSTYCTTYSSNSIQYFYILVNSVDYNDESFILNDSTYEVRIHDYQQDIILRGTFYKTISNGSNYYYSYKLNDYFKYNIDYDTDYDVYIVDSNNTKVLQLHLKNATDYRYSFTDFLEYNENSGEENPSSPDDNVDTNVVIDYDFNILHIDLLVLIVILGFYVFSNIIIIIVRNFSGGD